MDIDTEGQSTAGPSTSNKGQWQSLGVDPNLARSLSLRGFKNPTPIQRSTLPLTLATPPRDILGMARTGSGKTLAYLIPLLQNLINRPASTPGCRGLVLCPNRELALQILKAGKDLARGLKLAGRDKKDGLKWAMIIGGETLDAQFERMTADPDIIIATPGRFLHIIVEMRLDLRSVELVIYDEADRLFEMGFAVQLEEIISRLPPNRQNLLFSATLPSSVAEFAKGGLVNPTLVRLDTEQKISPDLKSAFFSISPQQKDAALLSILDRILLVPKHRAVTGADPQAIIFVATKHHVEYLCNLLPVIGYTVSHIYGSLDQVARHQQMQIFRDGESSLLVVTDVAARGLDLPILENVINYDMPAGARLFVHRVGRTARAGRKGAAWSLVATPDLPYFFDLQDALKLPNQVSLLQMGRIPQSILDQEDEYLSGIMRNASSNLASLQDVKKRGQSMFERSRPKASPNGHREAKHLISRRAKGELEVHPDMLRLEQAGSAPNLLHAIASYQPRETVFEIGKRGKGIAEANIMSARRATLQAGRTKAAKKIEASLDSRVDTPTANHRDEDYFQPMSNGDGGRDSYTIRGEENFNASIKQTAMDVTADEGVAAKSQKASQLRWDRKKKKFVKGTTGEAETKRIRTESGALVPATFNSGRYDIWKKRANRSVGGDKGHAKQKPSVSSAGRRDSVKTAAQIHIKRQETDRKMQQNGRKSKKSK